jgi:hypothetical protein
MKSRVKNLRNARKAKLTGNGGEPDKPNGRHWTQWIEPKGDALLSQMLGPIYFVIKNRGPGPVMLMAQQGDLMDLSPGAVRATYAHGTITVENRGEKRALIEFEFLPFHRK